MQISFYTSPLTDVSSEGTKRPHGVKENRFADVGQTHSEKRFKKTRVLAMFFLFCSCTVFTVKIDPVNCHEITIEFDGNISPKP